MSAITTAMIILFLTLLHGRTEGIQKTLTGPGVTASVISPVSPTWVNPRRPSRTPFLTAQGNTVRFSCRAEGVPSPTITWSKNGEIIKKNDRLGGYKIRRRSLTLESVSEDDDGTYECAASNVLGTIVRTFELQVQVRATSRPVVTDLKNRTLVVGENLMLECRAFGTSLRLEWLRHRNGSFVSLSPDIPRIAITKSIDGDNHTARLEIRSVSMDDRGQYTCLAGNVIAISHKTMWLDIRPVSEEERDITDEVFMSHILEKLKRLSPVKNREFRVRTTLLLEQLENDQQ